MKKIILIIVSLFFVTGCYDNIELNNLNIITSIGVDYKDEEFVVSYEVLNSQKSTDSITMSSYIESGSGKTISEAFNSASRKIGKKPYYAHLKIVIISDKLDDKSLEELMEYLIRKNNIRDEFYIAVTYDEPKKLLKSSTKEIPVIGIEAVDMLENSLYDNNIAITETFEKLYSKALGKKSDMIMSTFDIAGTNISLSGASVFHNYKLVDKLTIHETSIYNMLNNKTKGTLFTKEYDKGFISINIFDSKIKYTIKDNKIVIKGLVTGTVIDNTKQINLKSDKSYQKMNKDFSTVIENNIKVFIKKLQKLETDVLGLTEIYYKKTNETNYHLWKYLDIDVDIDVKINKKGLIFEV